MFTLFISPFSLYVLRFLRRSNTFFLQIFYPFPCTFFSSLHTIYLPSFFLSVFSVLSIFSSPLFSIARIISRDHLGSKDQNIDVHQSRVGPLLLLFKVPALQYPFCVQKSYQEARLRIPLYSLVRSKHIFQFSGNDR